MGDVGDDFKAWDEHKKEQRAKIEPNRFTFALTRLKEIGIEPAELWHDHMVLKLPRGTITFWPFTGWFQGQKPYGHVRGRGIGTLVSKLKGVGQ